MSRKFYYDPDSYTVLINFFNQNFNKIIGYELTKEENKQGYFYKLKDVSKNNIVLFNKSVNKSSNKKTKDNKLTTINLEKKEIVSDIIYNSKSINPNEFYIPLCETLNDNLLVIGEIKSSSNQNINNIYSKYTVGIKRNIYNEKGETILENKIDYENIFKEFHFFNGTDGGGRQFILKDYFNFKDNSFSILLQKQKNAGYFNDESTKDYIIVNFDPKGNFRNYKLFETAKQKFFNTYLFSEENKEKDEALFFYAERIKENNKKEWFLIINKIKDGVITQDKIPFKTDNSNLSFAKAKYGYIYVIESDKENKELSIRLEKLNL